MRFSSLPPSPGGSSRCPRRPRVRTGDDANSVFYVQTGGVKLSVLSLTGKEAVVAMLGPGDFFGEECLAGQQIRMGTAEAVVPTTALSIPKQEMT
jgi:CRP/FNR family cyclic AMP-dependent transcriptional regulator